MMVQLAPASMLSSHVYDIVPEPVPSVVEEIAAATSPVQIVSSPEIAPAVTVAPIVMVIGLLKVEPQEIKEPWSLSRAITR